MGVIRKYMEDDVPLTVLRENPKGGKSRDRYEAYKVATSAPSAGAASLVVQSRAL